MNTLFKSVGNESRNLGMDEAALHEFDFFGDCIGLGPVFGEQFEYT